MQLDNKTRQGEKPPGQRSGNRCGHDPESPRWFDPPGDHQPRPPLIRKCIDRIRQFFDRPETIPSLNSAHHARRLQDDPSHKARKMRSERREACCDLLGAIAHYCDLPTLCLSVPQGDGSLLPIRMDTLADRAGLNLRRAERAMRDIVDAGLLSVHKRAELQDDGTYIGHAAIRVLPPNLFGLFGLEARLEHDRRRLSQKRRKEQQERQPTRTEKSRLRTAISGALNKLNGNKLNGGNPTPPSGDAARFNLERPPGPANEHIRNILDILGGSGSGPEQPTSKADGDATPWSDESERGAPPLERGPP